MANGSSICRLFLTFPGMKAKPTRPQAASGGVPNTGRPQVQRTETVTILVWKASAASMAWWVPSFWVFSPSWCWCGVLSSSGSSSKGRGPIKAQPLSLPYIYRQCSLIARWNPDSYYYPAGNNSVSRTRIFCGPLHLQGEGSRAIFPN